MVMPETDEMKYCVSCGRSTPQVREWTLTSGDRICNFCRDEWQRRRENLPSAPPEQQADYDTTSDTEHMQPTPGPWDWSPQKGKPGECYQAQVWRPDGDSLATIESGPEANANARLVAAAPEMRAALHNLVEAAEDAAEVLEHNVCEADAQMLRDEMQAARKALRKAKGEM